MRLQYRLPDWLLLVHWLQNRRLLFRLNVHIHPLHAQHPAHGMLKYDGFHHCVYTIHHKYLKWFRLDIQIRYPHPALLNIRLQSLILSTASRSPPNVFLFLYFQNCTTVSACNHRSITSQISSCYFWLSRLPVYSSSLQLFI